MPLTFVQISDTHIGPTRDFLLYERPSLAFLERAITLINDLPQPPDFVLHSGDLVTDQSAASYEIAAEAMARLTVPVYYVAGNHDTPDLMRRYFDLPGGEPAGSVPLDYTFTVKGDRFLVLDAHNAEVKDPLGKLRESQLERVRSEATTDGPPLTVLLHYPPFPLQSPWLEANMVLVNGDALHEALLPARDRLRGVFFGHLHRSCQMVRDGIMYSCVPSTVSQFGWYPWDGDPVVDRDSAPGYNYVQYSKHGVTIRQYTIPLA